MLAVKKLAYNGIGMFGTAAEFAAPIVYAVDKAAELQKQMLGIQMVSRGTNQQMNTMRQTFESLSSQTIFSAIDVAKMAKIVETGTNFNASTLTAIMPDFVRFADIQSIMKGTPYETSVQEAVRLAHLANHYDPQSLANYLDLINKATLLEPGSLTEISNSLKYSQSVGKNALGISDEDMLLVTALANRLGFHGSRGGTNLLAGFMRSVPGIFGSGLLKGKSAEALKAMGMVDAQGHATVFSNGKFDIFKWIGDLSEYVQKEFATHPANIARQDILTNFSHAYGVQGSRIAELFATPQAATQLTQIGEAFHRLPGFDQMQQNMLGNSVWQKYIQAKSQFQNSLIELGTNLLPLTAKALDRINDGLKRLIPWMEKHKQLVKNIAYGFMGLVGALAIGGTILLLTSAFTGLAAIITPVTAGIAFLGFVLYKTYQDIKQVIDYFKSLHLSFNNGGGGTVASSNSNFLSNALHPLGTSPIGSRSANTTQVHTVIHLDGRQVAHAVTTHQARAAGAAPSTGSQFDLSRSLLQFQFNNPSL
jgi:TP901 family phage tail tape measure protein